MIEKKIRKTASIMMKLTKLLIKIRIKLLVKIREIRKNFPNMI